ncbi:DUF998 domain-containing protein [Aeromicrobium sp. CTD01-1L150]|uniref:DUF998 domain-containing protein n=1 Tax=Aeromicrobium sp. CTD01-1L150 TaxID=3341830 RepID=UPI0035C1EF92
MNTIETRRPHHVRVSDHHLAGTAAASAVTFAVLLGCLHVVRPELDPTWRFVSEYALGPAGFLMTAAFLAVALCSAALAVLMWRQVPGRVGRAGAVLAAVSAAGMVIAATFPTDPITAEEATLSGTLHNVGGQLNLTPFAVLLLTISLQRVASWRSVMPILWVVTGATLAASAAFMITAAGATDGFGPGVLTGLFGRVMLLGYVVWAVVAAGHVMRFDRTSSSAAAGAPSRRR